jgi:hypothetical protein
MAKQNPGPTQYKPTATQQVNNAMQQASAAGANNKAAANQQQVNRINAAMNQPSQQTKQNATTTQEALGSAYTVNANGQAPKNLNVGDTVKTNSGNNTVVGVNANGTYQMQPTQQAALDAAKAAIKQGAQNVVPNIQPNIDAANQKAAQGATGAKTTPTSSNTPAWAKGYDPSIDYAAEIAKALAAGDLGAAAFFESKRNQKIQAEGLNYPTTNIYAKYLDGVSDGRKAQLMSGYTKDVIGTDPTEKWKTEAEENRAIEEELARTQTDYATRTGINELLRAEEDAQPEFQKRLSQLDIDTARAMANSAFYAEARGDRGGIGQSQYNEVQAAALQNKQAINAERQKLATDTAREVADLREKGEFELATKLLQIRQNYLKDLRDIEETGLQYMFSREQWAAEREAAEQNRLIQEGQLMGVYKGEKTLSARNAEQEIAAAAGEMALKYGTMPTAEQLAAMGLTEAQAQAILWNLGFSGGGGRSSGGGGSGSSSGGDGNGNDPKPIEDNPKPIEDNGTTMPSGSAAWTGYITGLPAYQNPSMPYSELPFAKKP